MSACERRLIAWARPLCGGGLPFDSSGSITNFLLGFRDSIRLLPCAGSAVRREPVNCQSGVVVDAMKCSTTA